MAAAASDMPSPMGMAVDAPLVIPQASSADSASSTLSTFDREAILKELRARRILQQKAAQSRLLSWLTLRWQEAQDAKRSSGVTDQLEDSIRRIQGRYTDARKAELEKSGFPAFWFPITASKVNACKAWRGEYKQAQANGMFVLMPSTIPAMTPEVELSIAEETYAQAIRATQLGMMVSQDDVAKMARNVSLAIHQATSQEARDRAKAMQRVVQDDFDDENVAAVFDAACDDAIDFGTGIVKGPVVRRKKHEIWAPDGTKTIVSEDVLTCYAVNPQDMFPAPEKTRENDGAWQIERLRVHRNAIADLKESPYGLPDQIDAFLKANPEGSVQTTAEDEPRDRNERKDSISRDTRQEVYEFHGMIPGSLLKNFDIEDVDPNRDYSFIVTFTTSRLLEVRPNWDDLDREAYHWIPFKRQNGTIWGKGVPELVKSPQDAANGAWCALLVNCQETARPSRYGDQDRVVDPAQLLRWVAGTTIVTHNNFGQTAPPVGNLVTPDTTDKYLAVIRQAIADADVFSEVPAYQHGTDRAAGAGATYGGLQLLMEASGRGLSDFFFNIDHFGLEPTVTLYVAWHNDYTDDPGIKGDVGVMATGHRGLMMKAMQLSAIREVLDRMQNPMVLSLLGPGLYLTMWKKFMALNGILDIEDYMPPEIETAEWKAMVKSAMMQMAMGQGGASSGPQGGTNAMGTPPVPKGPAAEIQATAA